MKKLILLFFISSLVFSACNLPPELEDAPKIEFNGVYFIDVIDTTSSNGTIDALVLDFDFEDGDGNIGLDDSFNDRKFQAFEYILDDSAPGEDNRIKYGSKSGLPVYNPRDYEIEYAFIGGKAVPKDTFYVKRNENHYNFFVNLYVKKNGEYEYYDPWVNRQQTFNARIPVIRNDVKSTQGTIRYKWESGSWAFFLPLDTVRIEFFIKDRDLHQSNTLTTPDFMFRNLLQQKRKL